MDQSPSLNFSHIEDLIHAGKLDEAFTRLNGLDRPDLWQFDHYRIELYHCLILTRKDENREGNERIEHLITILAAQEPTLLLVDAQILHIELQFGLDHFSECLPLLLPIKETLDELKNITRAERILRDGLLIYWEGSIYLLLHRIPEGIRLLERSITLFESVNYKYGIGKCHYRLGACFSDTQERPRALTHYKQAIDIFEQLGNKQSASPPLNNLGLIYIDQGDLNQGLTYLKLSQEIDMQYGSKLQVAMSYNNIGEIYRLKGELDAALECYQHVLAMQAEIADDDILAFSHGNTGIIYWQKGELEQARECFVKSIKLLEARGNTKDTDEALYYLTIISIEMNDLMHANQYMNQLQLLAKKEEKSMVIAHNARLAEALVLRTSTKMRNRVKAEVILEQLATEENVSHELTVKALIHLTEIILINLKDEGELEDLERMKHFSGRLQEIAKAQHSHWVLVETYVLQAKIALLEGKVRDARRLLSLAQILAEEKGLQRLAAKISFEHDTLLNQIEEWEASDFQKLSLTERAELVHIDSLTKRMIRKEPMNLTEMREEKPVLLLILGSNGMSLFSTFFTKDAQLNEQLIGGLLSALNAFSGEVFANTLDRAKFGNYNLVMRPIEPIMICYLFEGPSYQATQKMDKVVQLLKENKFVWNSLANRIQEIQGLSSFEKQSLDAILQNVFTSQEN